MGCFTFNTWIRIRYSDNRSLRIRIRNPATNPFSLCCWPWPSCSVCSSPCCQVAPAPQWRRILWAAGPNETLEKRESEITDYFISSYCKSHQHSPSRHSLWFKGTYKCTQLFSRQFAHSLGLSVHIIFTFAPNDTFISPFSLILIPALRFISSHW